MEINHDCKYPDCNLKQIEEDFFCLEHAKLAQFIIEVVRNNIDIGDIV